MAKQKVAGEAGDSVVEGAMIQIDPTMILADDNTRFDLKESRIQSLAQSIIDQGGVMEPVEVEAIPAPTNGHKYRLTVGFYRHAAVSYLNSNQAAGLSIPAIVRTPASPTDRLKRQIAENMERENQSPMDQAVAIKKLLDAGVPKPDVRMIFSRPGGRKGNKVQMASNSYINMTMSFLDLPKPVQKKIHNGQVGVAAAYQLTKVAPEKRQQVLDAAEAEINKALEQEEKDEEKLLALEAKQAKAAEAKRVAEEKDQAAHALLTVAQEELETVTAETKEAYEKSVGKHPDAKAKKLAQSMFKTCEAARQKAESKAADAEREYDKVHGAFVKADTVVAEKAAKLSQTKTGKQESTKKAPTVGPQDVQKAAKSTGASSGAVALNASEMRKVIADMASTIDTVGKIGQALQRCFLGETTPDAMMKEVAKLTK